MTLYLGTDPASYSHIPGLVHYPVIKVIPLEVSLEDTYTHILFTSKNTVEILSEKMNFSGKKLVAIGKSTAAKLQEKGYASAAVAQEETQEGMIELLSSLDLKNAYLLYPRSSIARPNLRDFLIENNIRHTICDLYETVFQKPEPVPDLEKIDEIIFTSPSTVRGFIAAFGKIPLDKKLTCIGPVTETELKRYS